MKKSLLLATIAIVMTATSTARAEVAMSATSLLEHCKTRDAQPQSAAAQLCTSYISGFLEGAAAIDPRTERGLSAEEKRESWTKRAARTRLGRLDTDCGSRSPAYCFPQRTPISEVIAHFVMHGKTGPALLDVSAREAIYAVLRKHYPCR